MTFISDDVYCVQSGDAGLRLDRWLQALCPNFSKHALQKAIRLRDVRVNDARVKPSYRLKVGDRIWVFKKILHEQQKRVISRKDFEKQSFHEAYGLTSAFLNKLVLFEDQDLLIINKPTGYATQGGTGLPTNLLDAFSDFRQEKLYMVHRLDKETSGVWVLARHRHVAAFLSNLFVKGCVHKNYTAILKGNICSQYRKSGRYVSWLLKEKKGAAENIVSFENSTVGAKKALTLFEVLHEEPFQRLIDSEGACSSVYLVRFTPLTGRTHQLRVHALDLGAPIVGDGRYGKDDRVKTPLCLHAQTLSFPCLKTNRQRVFCAPIPKHFFVSVQKYFSGAKVLNDMLALISDARNLVQIE